MPWQSVGGQRVEAIQRFELPVSGDDGEGLGGGGLGG